MQNSVSLKTAWAKDFTAFFLKTLAGIGFQQILRAGEIHTRYPLLVKILVPCGLQRFITQ